MNQFPRDHSKVSLGVTTFGDVGIYAEEKLRRGERIASFDGPVFSWTTVSDSIPNDPPYFARDHAVQFEEFRARDSNGLARFANHSCSPNAGIRNLFDIVAMQDIEPGEEITWDYDMSEDTYWSMECRCQSPECRQVIAGYRFLPPKKRRQYQGFISEWLLTPHRAYLGPAIEAFASFPLPLVPPGKPFRHQLQPAEVLRDIMVITPEMIAQEMDAINGRRVIYGVGAEN